LVDGEPVLAGQIVRVVTTGGGGWGDPLEREPDLVLRDIIDGKISLAAARDDYGVVVVPGADADAGCIDEQATKELRGRARIARRSIPSIIDRGEGFEKMLRGEFKPWTRSA
jgi:N-methylhydantoinase B